MLPRILILFVSLVLTACSMQRTQSLPNANYVDNWQNRVESDPRAWIHVASRWFQDALIFTSYKAEAAYDMPTKQQAKLDLPLSNFHKLYIKGNFTVQITGDSTDKVEIEGPAEQIRQVIATVRGDTLILCDREKTKISTQQVLIRVSIKHLMQLVQAGCGQIEAINMHDKDVIIQAMPQARGRIFFAGSADIRQIVQAGNGDITIIGANSTGITINTSNKGGVYLSGKIAINCINHHGSNNIKVIGSTALIASEIAADGYGVITVNGEVNLQKLRVKGCVAFYAYMLNSNNVNIIANESSVVGIAGAANTLYVNTTNKAQLSAQHLCVQHVYIQTYQNSFASIYSKDTTWAAAYDTSLINFYGNPLNLAESTYGHGMILPVKTMVPLYCARQGNYSLKADNAMTLITPKQTLPATLKKNRMAKHKLHSHRH